MCVCVYLYVASSKFPEKLKKIKMIETRGKKKNFIFYLENIKEGTMRKREKREAEKTEIRSESICTHTHTDTLFMDSELMNLLLTEMYLYPQHQYSRHFMDVHSHSKMRLNKARLCFLVQL